MIISPYRFTTAPPPALGFDTSMLTGRQFVMSALQSPMYTGPRDNEPPATADGDDAMRVDGLAGPTVIRVLTNYGNVDALRLRLNHFGSGLPAITEEAASYYQMFTKPAATLAPSVESIMSNLFGANAKLVIFAGTINDARADQGAAYLNDFILADSSGYSGLHCYKSGSNAILQWYSYDSGGEDVRTATVPLGSPFVVACRHGSSVLGVSINNGAWVTTSGAGNTSDLSSGPRVLGLQAAGTPRAAMAALAICNNANTTDANVAAACTSAGALVGLTI